MQRATDAVDDALAIWRERKPAEIGSGRILRRQVRQDRTHDRSVGAALTDR